MLGARARTQLQAQVLERESIAVISYLLRLLEDEEIGFVAAAIMQSFKNGREVQRDERKAILVGLVLRVHSRNLRGRASCYAVAVKLSSA
jgi:hypothetical protein